MNNIPEYTVTQLNLGIKNLLEGSFEYVSVKGECGAITVPKSGHSYFSIKENDEVLSCICWKGSLEKLEIKIEEGVEYNFFGKITSFAKFGRSGYQLIINQIEFSGEGSILKLIEERRRYFDKLGYFDPKQKLSLPKYPKTIIVITSPTGAVIRDIIQRVNERYPIAKILVCPITVQGKNTHLEIIEFLNIINKSTNINHPSVVIFARGGGSLEEMMPFNEPDLIKNVFDFKFPTISAIGHQTDFTLLDYVCDRRAPTPSSAAEISTPDKNEIFNQINYYNSSNYKNIKSIYSKTVYRVSNFANILNVLINKIFNWQEKINVLIQEQLNFYKTIIESKKDKIAISFNLISKNNPIAQINQKRQYLDNNLIAIKKIISSNFNKLDQKIKFQDRIIKNSSIEKNLNKGYSLVFDNSQLLKSKAELKKSNSFKIKFKDGETKVYKK